MGIELTLLPVDGNFGDSGSCGFSHTILDLDRSYDLHEAINAEHPFVLDTFKLSSYLARIPDGSLEGDSCYGEIVYNPYGEKITYLDSTTLIRVMKSLINSLSLKNRAALAWLEAFTVNRPCKVALYWH